ncbi:hypothetical protein F5J12DRAFT_937441 [Pisolithus orientalis]|uniref:uncharacterized protein n=1 Tax=Pisolithus orientalis TaxID=936130 RepID=UPI0022257BA5|nr:uncharacterized protein F5J12DRAFT_937441 [Pisolithus orientalis]KAI6008333.1 hypothetical protein F5J12DRAFT_937441 [Pisolithus orientalis]
MADNAELQSPTTDVEGSLGAISEADAPPHSQHEASGTVDDHEDAQDDLVNHVQPDTTLDDNVKDNADDAQTHVEMPTQTAQVTATTKKPTGAAAKVSTAIGKDKPTKGSPVKPSPLSPTVKKVASSNVTAKTAPSSKAATTSITSALSKSTSTTPSTVKKVTPASPTNPSSKTTTMSSRPAPPQPSRRSSMLPPRAPSATGSPLPPKSRTSTLFSGWASSASSKPAPSDANASRPSVVSPSGSTTSIKSAAAPAPARPRASVSEAVKRTPSTSSKQAPPSTGGGVPTRAMRTVGSISSIREAHDDKALVDVQEKPSGKDGGLYPNWKNKNQNCDHLLDTALADAKAKSSAVEQLEQEKQSAEAALATARASLQRLDNEHARDLNQLNALKQQGQVDTLTSEIAVAEKNFESLRVTSDQSSTEAAAAAQAERESFLRAKADLDARASEVASLTALIEALKAEREENAHRISELEVEVLELKESQENAEDERNKLITSLKKAEADLGQAHSALEGQIQDANAKEEESAREIADLQQAYEEKIALLEDDLASAIAEIADVKNQLAAVNVSYEEMKKETETAAEEHERQLEESERSYLSKHIEFSEEIKRLSAELEQQEAKYNEKVEAVKAEHDTHLQEAFERAKGEAAELHGQELQALRAESQAAIEQLRNAHQSFVNDLEAEHQTTLDSQSSALEQKLNNQGLELRATQDDLTKAKSALEAARSECDNLKAQVEDARAAAIVASSNADQAAELERLSKQLASVRDENAMLNDVLAVTKESLSEMSVNHSKELEEAAKARVEEVTRLGTEHEKEISTLAAQKSELSRSLGDLENEIAMLKARLAAAESAAAPRSNGAVLPSTTNVTREELQKTHEAHNLKLHDLQAEHERVVRGVKLELETVQNRLEEVQSDLARRNMEIQYLEQEQEESQDSITRYVKVFGLQSLFGVVIALAVIFDFI